MSLEEANNKIKERTKKTSDTMIANYDENKNPFSRKYWINQGMSLEEANFMVNSRNHACKEFWLRKNYSIEESIKLARSAADHNSLFYSINKFGYHQGCVRYKQICDKVSQTSYFKILNKNHPNPIKYRRPQKFGASRQANHFFVRLYRHLRRCGMSRQSYQFDLTSKEFFIKDNRDIYWYDLCVHDVKLIVEFNGTHIHPNATIPDDKWECWRHAFSKLSADEIYKIDLRKKEIAISKGFVVMIVWSDDIIDQAIKIIVDKYKELKHEQVKSVEKKCESVC